MLYSQSLGQSINQAYPQNSSGFVSNANSQHQTLKSSNLSKPSTANPASNPASNPSNPTHSKSSTSDQISTVIPQQQSSSSSSSSPFRKVPPVTQQRVHHPQPCNSNDTPLSGDGLQYWYNPDFWKVYLERQKDKDWLISQSNLSETDKKNWQDIRTWDKVCGPDEIIVKMGIFKKRRGYYSIKTRMFLYCVCKGLIFFHGSPQGFPHVFPPRVPPTGSPHGCAKCPKRPKIVKKPQNFKHFSIFKLFPWCARCAKKGRTTPLGPLASLARALPVLRVYLRKFRFFFGFWYFFNFQLFFGFWWLRKNLFFFLFFFPRPIPISFDNPDFPTFTNAFPLTYSPTHTNGFKSRTGVKNHGGLRFAYYDMDKFKKWGFNEDFKVQKQCYKGEIPMSNAMKRHHISSFSNFKNLNIETPGRVYYLNNYKDMEAVNWKNLLIDVMTKLYGSDFDDEDDF